MRLARHMFQLPAELALRFFLKNSARWSATALPSVVILRVAARSPTPGVRRGRRISPWSGGLPARGPVDLNRNFKTLPMMSFLNANEFGAF